MPIRRKRRTKSAETGWGRTQSRRRAPRPWILWPAIGLMVVAGLITGWTLRSDHRESPGPEQAAQTDRELRQYLDSAESVARAFLAETDPMLRLRWTRIPEQVRTRLAEYPEEARIAVGEIESILGHQVDGAKSTTAFVVAFPSGTVRLLEVIATVDGPRVDWDAYARYGTASWDDLLSGKATRAVVRVFCEPSTERPEPFDDQRKWTCFRMSSQDLPQVSLGFAQVGHVREAMMRKVVLGSPNYRQRFTLEIARHAGNTEPLFEITRCLAVGWILGERDVEETWKLHP